MQSRPAGELRRSMDDPLSLEEHIVSVVTAFTRGQSVKCRRKATGGHWMSSNVHQWDFERMEYKVSSKPTTASPDPIDPPTIELELKVA